MKRISLRLLIIVLFALSASLITHPFRWSTPLTSGFLLLLNLFIILAAIYFGSKGVVVFGAFSLIVILLHSLRQAELAILPLALLAATSCIFYIYSLKTARFAHKINVELGNIQEQENILTVELEHARLENTSLKEKLQKYATLKGLTESLSSTLSLDKAVSLITDEAFRIIGKSNASLLYLVNKEKQELNLVSAKLKDRRDEVKLKKDDVFDNHVFKQRIPLVVEDTKKDFRFNLQDVEEKDKRGIRSLIAAPLISQKKLLGVLRLDNASPKVYDADDLRLLDIIADLSAVTIENTLLYRETEKLAMTDGLTGLFVHRHFQQRFEQEISRALWTNSQFAFLMLDIDNFKRYNDKYGHIAGDIVLKKIAKLISSSVNPGDIVARYGGEEFGVLLVDSSKLEAEKIAQAIRDKIAKKDFVLRRETAKVYVSGGIASFPEDGKVKEDLIAKADQALYKAKAEGKNRICTL